MWGQDRRCGYAATAATRQALLPFGDTPTDPQPRRAPHEQAVAVRKAIITATNRSE